MDFIVYDMTGKIHRAGSCPDGDFMLQAMGPGESVLEGVCNIETDYVLDGEVTPRPVINLEDTTRDLNQDLILLGIPVGSLLFVDDVETGEITQSTVLISFPVLGVWTLRIEAPFPWISDSCEVTVV